MSHPSPAQTKDDVWIILGASSAMARAFARALAKKNAHLILCGRDLSDLAATANDCRARGAASAIALTFDARDTATFIPILEHAQTLIQALPSALASTLNCAVFVGSMPSQGALDTTPELLSGVVQDSHIGPATFLQMLAPMMEERGAGTVVGVTSVAGDRGRLSNYVYGSAKAGFATYLAGLRNRLTRSGGHVVTVKPGFVDTAMTWNVEGMFLVASPDSVAQDILRAISRKKNVIYTPFFWRYIMAIIRSIPEALFKKLSI
jgi:short-subunit dehydrogenase